MIDLIMGDCVEVMKDIPDGSVDMVLCDLPYGTTACKWDILVPFESLWPEYWRICKPSAAIVLTASQPFTTALISSQIKHFKYEWIWRKNKGSGFLNSKNSPIKMHENICVFSKGKTANGAKNRMSYYPQGLVRVDKIRKQPDFCESVGTRPSRKSDYLQEFTGYPSTMLDFANDGNKLHPTQKPVALMEYLIRTYTNEGETVLDNTMGSGTTGVAARNTGRSFIGIERDDNYFKIASDRILIKEEI